MREFNDDDIRLEEVIDWIEFAGWSTLVLYPIMYLIYGPSVSTDQYIIRTALLVIALLAALCVRAYKIINARRNVS